MPLEELSNHDTLLRWNLSEARYRAPDGAPLVDAAFVAHSGMRTWKVRLLEDGEDPSGVLGHLPSALGIPFDQAAELSTLLGKDAPVVLLCSSGERSADIAQRLEREGMPWVVALAGGVAGWRRRGLSIDRAHLSPFAAPTAGTGSDGRPLSVERSAAHLDEAALLEHLGDPARLTWAKLASFMLGCSTFCVDGRDEGAVVGTPGGDAGELLLALAAVEDLTSSRVDPGGMATILRAYADTFGEIYMHTDNIALAALVAAVRNDSTFTEATRELSGSADWMAFLRCPPFALRGALLDYLLHPAHVGCWHIRLSLERPDTYHVRSALVRAFLTAFFTQLWDGSPDLNWVILGGAHAEGALVNVTVEGNVQPFSRIPLVSPNVSGIQMFVNHPQAAAFLRQQLSHFATTQLHDIVPSGVSAAALAERIPELGGVQTMETLKSLAAGLPIFEARFSPGAGVEIIPDGYVPAP